MKLWSNSFEDGAPIPVEYAFGKHDPETNVTLSDNKNPHFAWKALPEGTRSLALVCHDPDVPSVGDDVNQEGRTVPAGLRRVDFYHWVLFDIDPAAGAIAAGSISSGVTARGKDGPAAPNGWRHGVNNYTDWFAGDDDMSGDYYGYDGPCPPWNDEIVHHYHFTLYALGLDRVPLEGRLGGPELMGAIEGHILGHAKLIGTYAINPAAR